MAETIARPRCARYATPHRLVANLGEHCLVALSLTLAIKVISEIATATSDLLTGCGQPLVVVHNLSTGNRKAVSTESGAAGLSINPHALGSTSSKA